MSDSAPLDGRQQRGRDTRALIVDAAMAQFAESGYRASSLRDIAARAGMTHPGVLYHFPTKEALLMAVLQRRDDEGKKRHPVLGHLGREALAGMARAAAHNETQGAMVELYAVLSAEATGRDHPAHDYFVARYESLLATVTEAYTVARDAGGLRDGVEPDVAAPQLIALMDGLQVQWLMGTLPRSMARIVADHLNTQLVEPLP
ncbi:TetR/AcrR family transcriptional regulator [Demequina activiva]|uniref:TetR family transcriptional regulator n=1 Tax=Demequina activiva TaxID=1582364 RepID=A0A919Q5U5_9MICO|nr:TetR/AcrR family transcriptional regulator [Demequina activiva]GIG55073.1 TetR family transcriptional regulator [Demequina activiva]